MKLAMGGLDLGGLGEGSEGGSGEEGGRGTEERRKERTTGVKLQSSWPTSATRDSTASQWTSSTQEVTSWIPVFLSDCSGAPSDPPLVPQVLLLDQGAGAGAGAPHTRFTHTLTGPLVARIISSLALSQSTSGQAAGTTFLQQPFNVTHCSGSGGAG